MHLIHQLFLSSILLIAITAATPLTKHKQFTIHQTASKMGRTRMHGMSAVAKAYRRYGKSMPANIADAASTMPDTVASSPNAGDEEYVSVVTIGGQQVTLDFDTGSSDLWVYSTELPQSQIGNHSIYDPSKSSTSKKLDQATWQISYGDSSSANGDVYTDTVTVGGATVPIQAVELASNVSSGFLQDFSNDGLLGLAFDNLNTVQPIAQKTFFTNVKDNLPLPVFTADLKHAAPGSYDFGFINSSRYTGTIEYIDVDSSQGFWVVNGTGYGVGADGKKMKKTSIPGIVDTGTTLLLLPQKIVKAYYKKVKGVKNNKDLGYTFPCSAELSDFYLSFGAYTAKIAGDLLNLGPKDPNDASTCLGGMQIAPLSPDSPPAIFGDVFLKSTFVVFKAPSGETPSVGFAAKATDPLGPLESFIQSGLSALMG